jgi:predicted acyl esterase
MNPRRCLSALFFALIVSASLAQTLPSDIPPDFKVRELEKDFVARKEMIPMRDGVKLNTLIVIPKGAKNAPVLMDRTPYNIGIYEPYIASSRNHHPSLEVPGDGDLVASCEVSRP